MKEEPFAGKDESASLLSQPPQQLQPIKSVTNKNRQAQEPVITYHISRRFQRRRRKIQATSEGLNVTCKVWKLRGKENKDKPKQVSSSKSANVC